MQCEKIDETADISMEDLDISKDASMIKADVSMTRETTTPDY